MTTDVKERTGGALSVRETVKEGRIMCVRKGCEEEATLAVLTRHVNQVCSRLSWFTLCDSCFEWVLSKIAELHDILGEGRQPICRYCLKHVLPSTVLLDVRVL